MGDKDRRHACALLDTANLLTHLKAQARIQIGERLVEQQQARILDQRASNGHALLLAAGELRRPAVHQHVHMHQLRDFLRPLDALRLGDLLRLQGEADVAHHRHVRVERVILENQADAALFRRQLRHVLIVKVDLAAGHREDAGEHVQQRALAAARRAQQGNQLSILQRRAEFADRRHIGKALCDMIEYNAHSRISPRLCFSNPGACARPVTL